MSKPTHSLSDRAGLLIVANLIKYAIGFIMPMVLVRLLTQSDYGTYQQMILVGNVAVGILTLSLPTSVYYFYHHVDKARLPTLIAQTSAMLAGMGALAAISIALATGLIAENFNNPALLTTLPLFAISIGFMIASEHSIAFMIAQNRFTLAVIFEVAETFVRVSLLLTPLYFGFGLTALIGGIVVYAMLRFIVRSAYLFGRSDVRFAGWTRHTFQMQQLAYCAPLTMVALTAVLGMAFNRGILALTFTPKDFAIYAVGALEIPLDVIFQASVANVLRASLPPLIRDGNISEVVRLLREAARKLSIIVLPSFIFLFGHAEQFITLLFTSNYLDSVPIFRIYLFLMPLTMFILSPIPQVFGKTRVNFYINITVLSAVLISSYGLLKLMGFFGPALAFVASQYLGSILFIAVALKLTHSSLTRLLPLKHMFLVLLSSLLALVAAKLFDQLAVTGLLGLFLAGVVFSISFLVVAVATGVLTREDQALIRRWIAKVLPIKAE